MASGRLPLLQYYTIPLAVLQDRRPELRRLARVGRTRLASTPTPLLPARALSARLRPEVGVLVKADA